MSKFEKKETTNYKIIMIGKSGAGKSTLLLRYVDGFYDPQKSTVGIDFKFKKVSYQGHPLNLQIWDSAGQQRYRTIVYNYFYLSKGACIVFDLWDESSFQQAKSWLLQSTIHCNQNIPKVLLGNKSDLFDCNKLTDQLQKLYPLIDDLRAEFGCEFYVVNAVKGDNLDSAFKYLVQNMFQKQKGMIKTATDGKITLNGLKEQQKGKGQKKFCC